MRASVHLPVPRLAAGVACSGRVLDCWFVASRQPTSSPYASGHSLEPNRRQARPRRPSSTSSSTSKLHLAPHDPSVTLSSTRTSLSLSVARLPVSNFATVLLSSHWTRPSTSPTSPTSPTFSRPDRRQTGGLRSQDPVQIHIRLHLTPRRSTASAKQVCPSPSFPSPLFHLPQTLAPRPHLARTALPGGRVISEQTMPGCRGQSDRYIHAAPLQVLPSLY